VSWRSSAGIAVRYWRASLTRPYHLGIILQCRHRCAPLRLTPIPVQMRRVVPVTALARFQTQRLFAKTPRSCATPGASASGKSLPLDKPLASTHPPPHTAGNQSAQFPLPPDSRWPVPAAPIRASAARLPGGVFLPAFAKCRDTASRSAGKETSSAARSSAEMFSSSASGNTKLTAPSACACGHRSHDGSNSFCRARG
jgi:hypothetical protein